MAKRYNLPLHFEHEFKNEDIKLFKKLLENDSWVIQCPALSYCIEDFSKPDVSIVFCMRPIVDIILSQQKIKWEAEQHELKKYKVKEGPISKVKYDHWKYQRTIIHNPHEIEYESLRDHPDFGKKNGFDRSSLIGR